MGVSENLDLVRRGYAAFTAGDLDTLQTLFKPDIVHAVPGTSPIAGEHKGTDEVFAMYGNLFALSEGTMSIQLEDVLSDGGDRVVAIHTAQANRNGEALTSREALLFTIEGDKVASIQDFFPDIEAQDQFWS
ncbi:MAG: nuclear transport factor 2 family protein [Acidimicrobiales bacterium]